MPVPNPVPLSKSQPSDAALSSPTQYQNKTAVHRTITNTVMTSSISSVATKPVTSVSGSKTLLLYKKPSAVKIIPGFLKDTTTTTFRILPQIVFEEVKKVTDPKTSSSSTRSSSEGHSTNQDLRLTVQSCLSPKNQNPEKSDGSIHTGSTPNKEVCGEDSQSSNMSPIKVIFADHSYTFEKKRSKTSKKKPVDVSKNSSGFANVSTYHMLFNEVLDLGLAKKTEDCGTTGAVLGTGSGDETRAGSHLVEEAEDSDSTELTEDSDLYNDTDFSQSSDDEDQCVVTVRIKKNTF